MGTKEGLELINYGRVGSLISFIVETPWKRVRRLNPIQWVQYIRVSGNIERK